jgi:hypothetical protein
MQEEMTK